MEQTRTYDIVLFGATGFTGGLTAEYLAHHAPSELRWALAGRNARKLEDVRTRLAAINPALADLDTVVVDAADADALGGLAQSTNVVITTVGPYWIHGEPLVAACAEKGTDYVDLTGEPEFVDAMWLRHHERALESGARIVHCCGFDSMPHDLGAFFTVLALPEDVPLRVEGFVRGRGSFSGGTFHSAINAFARMRQTAQVALERRRRETLAPGRKTKLLAKPLRRDRSLGGWAVPLPTIDPFIVRRSAQSLERYGPDFSYGHYGVAPNLALLSGFGLAAAGAIGLAQIPPARRWLLTKMDPGEGPSEEQRARSWFKVRFLGEGGGRKVVCEVSGADPGYGETSKMLAEAGLCLAFDELPPSAGQVSTATAMGEALIARLQRAGISFEVLQSGAS